MITQVTPEIRESIDWYLGALAWEWEIALDVVRDPESLWGCREHLWAEWFLAIDHLGRLLRYQRDGMFSPEQEHRFQEFRQFMLEHEAELETVLGPGGVRLNPTID